MLMHPVSPQEYDWLLREKYDGTETSAFRTDLERLEAGEPLAYVIGYVPFLGTVIHLDSRPLIPRPETEFWVERALEELVSLSSPRILDLCAGSGCVGVAALSALPTAQVDFAEIDEVHHDTIRKNLKENGIDAVRARILGGDLFACIEGPYDAILANPPYLDPNRTDRLEESVRAHEPERALFGGEEGMELLLRILKDAPHYLTPGGLLYLEHEPEQAEAIARAAGAYTSCTSHEDQWQILRYTRLQH